MAKYHRGTKGIGSDLRAQQDSVNSSQSHRFRHARFFAITTGHQIAPKTKHGWDRARISLKTLQSG